MSSKEDTAKQKEEILASRAAKKLAKQKNKTQTSKNVSNSELQKPINLGNEDDSTNLTKPVNSTFQILRKKSKDEVDKAFIEHNDIKVPVIESKQIKKSDKKITTTDVIETLNNIVNIAREVQDVTAKVKTVDLNAKKVVEGEKAEKSKAELKAERRAKQEAQRAAKQAALEQKQLSKADVQTTKKDADKKAEVKPIKKVEKAKINSELTQRVNWFQHLENKHDKNLLKKIPLNSNLHPAIIRLGVQLESGEIAGSNARCIGLLHALKKMISDYTLPAKTEFSRGVESQLKASTNFLWSLRPPSASQTNALHYIRHYLTQLPNNVDEFDAKKIMHEEIDRYIREQIDMAGEAISITVRSKISNGDTILTYGRSRLIERILIGAWGAGLRFRVCVVGGRGAECALDSLRLLTAAGLPCSYYDITSLYHALATADKVLVGASSVLGDGSVVGRAGTAQTALAARSHGIPVLVACETHKFSPKLHTDAFVHNEIADPDSLTADCDGDCPLRGWRSCPTLSPLRFSYDVTPPSLVSALATELAMLPATSAPVVLRFKHAEYNMG